MMPQSDVLLVTVNPTETTELLRVFEQAAGHKAKMVRKDNRVYQYLGDINTTRVYHAMSEMGSAGPGGTLQTVDKAIRALKPTAVVCVGVAFGMNEKKQSLGDILVSQQLRLYDLERVGRDAIVLRGDKPHASSRLVNFFRVAQTSWGGVTVRMGVILSGDKLVDNIDYRNQLQKLEPEAIGKAPPVGSGGTTCCRRPDFPS
jgi:nucleoside phosphorylase